MAKPCHVTRVEFDSNYGAGGEVEITIARGLPDGWPSPNDLPPDFVEALWKWLAPTRRDYCDLCGAAPCSNIVACASARD